ncbi:MAG TPA: hypothetical protein VGN79_11840 [Devosia sp.]|jgi:hypothetical protein|nr:hypothetical protein [Devosia sp.]
MKKTLIITTAALFATTAMPSFAQDASATTSTDANTSVETPAMDADVSAGGAMDADTGAGAMDAAGSTAMDAGGAMSVGTEEFSDNSYEAALAGIQTSGQVEFDLIEEDDIVIMLLSELEGDAETGNVDIDAALDANADVMSALHTSISDNEAIVSSLEAEGDFTAEDVVAVRTNSDGMLVVYVDDRDDA